MLENKRSTIQRANWYGGLCAALMLSMAASVAAAADSDDNRPILPLLGQPTQNVSTVPSNGDVNPYGVAFVPEGFAPGGALSAGDIVVSNFNDKGNLQGTGRTIVSIAPDGATSLFFEGSGSPRLGLTTALGVLKRGFVLVGNVPTSDGTFATIQRGSILVIDKMGHQIETLRDSNLLDGPWDLTIDDQQTVAKVFVSNVLNGTVTRLDLVVTDSKVFVVTKTRIASGYLHRSDPAALVVGPTGVAYDVLKDLLYVASTGDNAIYAVADAGDTFHDAGKGTLVFQDTHLRGPLALALAPNGNLVTSNGDAVNPDPTQPSEIVEFTPAGRFVAEFSVTGLNIDNSGAQGAAFGLALVETSGDMLRFAAVDDNNNSLDEWAIRF